MTYQFCEPIQAKALTVELQAYVERSCNLVPSILCKHQCHWTIISQAHLPVSGWRNTRLPQVQLLDLLTFVWQGFPD